MILSHSSRLNYSSVSMHVMAAQKASCCISRIHTQRGIFLSYFGMGSKKQKNSQSNVDTSRLHPLLQAPELTLKSLAPRVVNCTDLKERIRELFNGALREFR